jgi:hypothetical protein
VVAFIFGTAVLLAEVFSDKDEGHDGDHAAIPASIEKRDERRATARVQEPTRSPRVRHKITAAL